MWSNWKNDGCPEFKKPESGKGSSGNSTGKQNGKTEEVTLLSLTGFPLFIFISAGGSVKMNLSLCLEGLLRTEQISHHFQFTNVEYMEDKKGSERGNRLADTTAHMHLVFSLYFLDA